MGAHYTRQPNGLLASFSRTGMCFCRVNISAEEEKELDIPENEIRSVETFFDDLLFVYKFQTKVGDENGGLTWQEVMEAAAKKLPPPWLPHAELEKMVRESSLAEVGKKFGVYAVAVRAQLQRGRSANG